MRSYFFLQCKRIKKILPLILGITLALFLAVGLLLALLPQGEEQAPARFRIGITGDTKNEFIALGVGAFQTFDSSRFTIEFEMMEQEQAQEEFAKGRISAYVILPENFIEKALHGTLDPIQYVTGSGESGLVPIFKYEITEAITDLLIYSEKGTYGFAAVGEELGMRPEEISRRMDEISLEYVAMIIHRADVYTVETVGVAEGDSLIDYYIGGLSVFLLMLMGLPFAVVMIRKDASLSLMLRAKGHSPLRQLLCEYGAHCGAMLLLIGLLFALLWAGQGFGLLPADPLAALWGRMLPVLMMVCAFNLFLFEACASFVSGVLTHFLLTLGLCYLSGCFYPLYAFPITVQKMAPFLPTGAARLWLTPDAPLQSLGLIGGYLLLFFLLAQAVRSHKLQRRSIG